LLAFHNSSLKLTIHSIGNSNSCGRKSGEPTARGLVLGEAYIGYSGKHYLVVPHHGGNAGKFTYELETKTKVTSAVISVGKNPYGHPLKRNMDSLRRLGFTLLKTNTHENDIEIDMQN
jgi:hypothetical protein